MSAHPALSMVDILIEIFEWYDSWTFSLAFREDKDIERTRTLAHAACACRSFQQAAIRVLWRDLHDILPLLKLLPALRKVTGQDTDVSVYGDHSETYHLPDDVPVHEWDRMLQYSVHVQALQTRDFSAAKLTPASWSTMSRFAENHCILPNLQWIDWTVDLSHPLAMLHFLSNRTQTIILYCDSPARDLDKQKTIQWQSHLGCLVTEICKRCPDLIALKFDIGNLPASAVVPHIPVLRSLEEFTLSFEHGSLDYSHMRALAAMPALDAVALTSAPTGAVNTGFLDASDNFRALQSLTLERWDTHSSILTCPSLRRFEIANYMYDDDCTLRQHCKTWAGSFPRLEAFSCYIRTEALHDQDHRYPIASVIAPLMSLPTLKDVEVEYSTYIPFWLTDVDFLAMSEAWPSLVSFSIYEASLGHDYPSCTAGLPGLLALAKNCPDLKMISLRRLDVGPEDLSSLPAEPLDHGLQSFNVRLGMANDVYEIVTSRLFPHLLSKL
ncbi:hypothetical protein BV20DRAFT_994954 [Pilatotrama ljubarskyi]|nr:hypothetical protein BV20DRAFT_994954 [Pilatotrama ljubarskyi]